MLVGGYIINLRITKYDLRVRPLFVIVESQGAHSAHVEMRLILDGSSIGITHMASDYILIKSSIDYPPGEASIVLQVDKSIRRWQVFLPEGISKSSKRVALAPCQESRQAQE